MMPWYATALLTMGGLIAGHMWGILACKQPLDEAFDSGYESGITDGRELERSLHAPTEQSFWGKR